MNQNFERPSWSLSKRDALVMAVVVWLVVAILLPYAGEAREAARRSDCKNKLRQIGIALHNYHETFSTFPSGWVATGPEVNGQPEESAYSWLVASLQFYGPGPLPNLIKRDDAFQVEVQRVREIRVKGGRPWPEKTLGEQHLLGFRCPSDAGFSIDTTSSVPQMATSNYVGNFGVGIPRFGRYYGVMMQGIFGEKSRIRIRDIRDGTTNTVLVGERRLPDARLGHTWREGELEGSLASYWAGFPRGTSPLAIVATVTDGELPACDADVDTIKRAAEGDLNLTGHLRGAASAHGEKPRLRVARINSSLDGVLLQQRGAVEVSTGFSSYHPGGTQLLLGDGSVRFVDDTLDVGSLLRLIRRADGTFGEDSSF